MFYISVYFQCFILLPYKKYIIILFILKDNVYILKLSILEVQTYFHPINDVSLYIYCWDQNVGSFL